MDAPQPGATAQMHGPPCLSVRSPHHESDSKPRIARPPGCFLFIGNLARGGHADALSNWHANIRRYGRQHCCGKVAGRPSPRFRLQYSPMQRSGHASSICCKPKMPASDWLANVRPLYRSRQCHHSLGGVGWPWQADWPLWRLSRWDFGFSGGSKTPHSNNCLRCKLSSR